MEDLDHKFNCLNVNEVLPKSIKLMCYHGIVSHMKQYKYELYPKFIINKCNIFMCIC